MQEKFRHVRDRLKGNLPFHGSGWGKIINCRQTRVKEGSVVQLLDLEVQADAIPIVDFPIQTMMIFLARHMSTELLDEAPHVPAPTEAAVPPRVSHSRQLFRVRLCPYGHNYDVQPLQYRGTCNQCGAEMYRGQGCGHCFECSPTWLMCEKCSDRYKDDPGVEGWVSAPDIRGAGPHGDAHRPAAGSPAASSGTQQPSPPAPASGAASMDSVHCRMQPLTWPYCSKCGVIVKSLRNKPANRLRRTLSLRLCASAVAPRSCRRT